MRKNKGFTLIEMLVVIAIIAVLVAIVIPVVGTATTKAEAAADAANLRNVLGYMNTVLITQEKTIDEAVTSYEPSPCKLYPDAELYLLYTHPGFIDVYYKDGTNYYGLDYYSEMALEGTSSISTAKPAPSVGVTETWYKVGP